MNRRNRRANGTRWSNYRKSSTDSCTTLHVTFPKLENGFSISKTKFDLADAMLTS